MKMFSINTLAIALSILCVSCSKPEAPGQDHGETDKGEPDALKVEQQRVLNNTRATKIINPFDELANRRYAKSGLQYSLSNDRRQGKAAFALEYSFTGKSSSEVESVWFEQTGGDFRSDLSLEPLGLSLWVKGRKGNKGVFRFVLMEDENMFSENASFDRTGWQYFIFEDREVLSKEGWHKVVMPYSAFKLLKNGDASSSETPALNRFAGYRIEIVNEEGVAFNDGLVCVDELKQLTSFEVKENNARFTSMFIQLNYPYYNGTNWGEQFRDSKAIGIDTWIIQAAGQFGDEKVSFYKNSAMDWTTKTDYIDNMFEAAEREGMKIILGLYPGHFTRYNFATQACYDKLFNQHKQCFDELFEQYGKHPCLAGWYIPEEFHDGSGIWQQKSGLTGLATYYEKVASYIKTKSDKPVCIAPALWRGMPADIVGKWFEDFFFIAQSIDFLYLQDCGGRVYSEWHFNAPPTYTSFFLTDPDVDLPNWYAEIKKACENTGVEFGVDLESFREDTYGPRAWKDVLVQLQVAGMFTEHITNFSWVTFKKGTPGYEGYKTYLQKNKTQNN